MFMIDCLVAVGMAVTRHPPHRSVRAELPHTAPALGFNAEASYRMRMHWIGYEQTGQGSHAFPVQAVSLTPPFKGMPPRIDDFTTKAIQSSCITGYVVVVAVYPLHEPHIPSE